MANVIHVKRAKSKVGTVASLMTRPAITVSPDLSLDSLQQLFVQRGLSRVPVVDVDGRAIGLIGKTDLINDRVLGPDPADERPEQRLGSGAVLSLSGAQIHAEPRTVEDVMTKGAVTVAADQPLWVAAELMADCALHGLPVVDGEGIVVGMVRRSTSCAGSRAARERGPCGLAFRWSWERRSGSR